MYKLRAELTLEELDTLLGCIVKEREQLVELKLDFVGENDYIKIINSYIQLLDTLKSKLRYEKVLS